MGDMLQIGEIVNTHGVKGDVKVYPYTDDITRFDRLSQVILRDKKGFEKTVKINSVKYFKGMVIMHLAGTESMNDAEKLRGYGLFVGREDAIPLKENEYYIADLIGLPVKTEHGEELGTLRDVMETGANDVYVVRKKEEELLIPAIKECILDVDLKKREMTVHLMDGMR